MIGRSATLTRFSIGLALFVTSPNRKRVHAFREFTRWRFGLVRFRSSKNLREPFGRRSSIAGERAVTSFSVNPQISRGLDTPIGIHLEDEQLRHHHLRDGRASSSEGGKHRCLPGCRQARGVNTSHLLVSLVLGRFDLDDRLVKLALGHDLRAVGRDQVTDIASQRPHVRLGRCRDKINPDWPFSAGSTATL